MESTDINLDINIEMLVFKKGMHERVKEGDN